MAVVSYSPGAAWSGFQSWLMGQGLQYCQQQQSHGIQQFSPLSAASGTFLGIDDSLTFSAWTYMASTTVRLRGRLVRPDGTVSDFQRDLTPNTNLSQSSVTFKPGAGLLQWLAVSTANSLICRGSTYATAVLNQGAGSTPAALATLLAGYLSYNVPLTWPGSPLEQPIDGRGIVWQYTGTNPAAGAEPNIFSGPNVRWQMIQFQVSLTTDATVGNRRLVFHAYDTDGNPIIEAISPYDHPASTTRNYIFQAGAAEQVQITDTILVPVACCGPPIYDVQYNVCVHGTWGAADNFGTPSAEVEEWLELC